MLTVQSSRIGEQLISECSRINAADVSVDRVDAPAGLTVTRTSKALEVICTLIRFSGDAYYLQVLQDAIWLLPDDSVNVDVRSNVRWTIE